MSTVKPVSQAETTPRVKVVFDDIRATRGSEHINHFWRYLAFDPSLLEATWAEVMVGGVDTRALSSQTLEAQAQPGLYFIGEVVDVTGWLGGYNFQWAWASAAACADALAAACQPKIEMSPFSPNRDVPFGESLKG